MSSCRGEHCRVQHRTQGCLGRVNLLREKRREGVAVKPPIGVDPQPEFATAEECKPDVDRQPISGWFSGRLDGDIEKLAEALSKPIAVSVNRPVMLTADVQTLRALGREVDELKAQLKVMTEDRDEYQGKLQGLESQRLDHIRTHHPDGWVTGAMPEDELKITVHMQRMSKGELRLLRLRADKLMNEGRKEYGPLDMSTDERSLEDLVREAFDEKEDSAAYLDMAMLRIELDREKEDAEEGLLARMRRKVGR